MENIKNNELVLYLEMMCKKNIKDISTKELEMITSIPINCYGEEINNDFDVLKNFPNLERINISNTILREIDLEEISKLSKIKTIELSRCIFRDEKALSIVNNISKLNLYNCYLEDYSFLKNFDKLEELRIYKPFNESKIYLSDIESKTKIKLLEIENSYIYDLGEIKKFENCEELSLLFSTFNRNLLKNITEIKKLKKLYISKSYMDDEDLIKLKERVEIRDNKINLLFEVDTENVNIKNI